MAWSACGLLKAAAASAVAVIVLIAVVASTFPALQAAAGLVFEFDNGVKVLTGHLEPGQVARYGKATVVLHEPHEESWFTRLLHDAKRGDVFVDIGAAAGYYCLLALRMRPQLAVVAVNPSPYFRAALKSQAGIQTHRVRVTEPPTEADLLRPGGTPPVQAAILQLAAALGATGGGRVSIGKGYGSGVVPPRRQHEQWSTQMRDSVPQLELPQLVAALNRTVYLAMFDIQSMEGPVFRAQRTQALLRSHTIERLMVAIHHPKFLRPVVHSLRTAGYRILFNASSVKGQPDGVVIALSPLVTSLSDSILS